jgi:hypothetical protein
MLRLFAIIGMLCIASAAQAQQKQKQSQQQKAGSDKFTQYVQRCGEKAVGARAKTNCQTKCATGYESR